jgi:hypothetical protein
VRPVEQIMAAFNVVHRSHTRFVAEGRGQDFADLVDELLSGTSPGVLRRRCCSLHLGTLQATALPMTSPALRMHLGLSDLYAAGRHPLTCGTSTRKEAHRKLRPTLLSPPCSSA